MYACMYVCMYADIHKNVNIASNQCSTSEPQILLHFVKRTIKTHKLNEKLDRIVDLWVYTNLQ